MMEQIVTLFLGGVVAFSIFMYVLLDGFDLGVGIIFPWVNNAEHRQLMVNTLVPVWDGNETWLVLGGATLYGAFPVVYSTILPELYLPLIMMLAGLVLRGVSFEFLFKAKTTRFVWSTAFTLGSMLAAFCQGIVLGTFVQGFSENGQLISTLDYHWLSPFSMMTGFSLMIGYALLGATWLVRKTEGDLRDTMYHVAKVLLAGTAIAMLTVSLWTPFIDPAIKARWFSLPNFFILLPLPVLTFAVFISIWRQLATRRHDNAPFYLTICLFLLPYIGFAISLWPYIIPRAVTVWDAAAPWKAQAFILPGIIVLLPALLIYTGYSYHVFRGKVTSAEGYH